MAENIFRLSVKQDGEWQKVNAVFPFIFGELLDERLDEANVTFFSSEKSYKPLTDFKAALAKEGQADNVAYKRISYILANDDSHEYPAGSGKYKHSAYLIERTKLLEGFLCPSLTFTNSKTKAKTTYKSVSPSDYSADEDAWLENYLETIQPEYLSAMVNIYSPIDADEVFYPPTMRSVFESTEFYKRGYRLQAIDYYNDGTGTYKEIKASVKITDTAGHSYSYIPADLGDVNDHDEMQRLCDSNFVVDRLEGDVTIVYTLLCYQLNSQNFGIRVKYNIKIEKRPRMKRNTITDCILRVLELAEPITKGAAPRFILRGMSYTGDTPNNPKLYSGDAKKYEKILAPEFSMTQATLREQLKIIGSYIHAEPRLDENNTVYFVEYGSTEEETQLSKLPYISNSLKTDINQYCTDIRSNAQNLVSSLGYARGAVIEPAGGLYRSLRSETMYSRITSENGEAATDMPIYEIDSVLCGIAGDNDGIDGLEGWQIIAGATFSPKEIKRFVFEQTEYNANLDSFNGGFPHSKAYAVYYTQGAKNIKGLFYHPPNAASAATYSPYAIANILAVINGVPAMDVYNHLLLYPRNLVFQITYKPIGNAFLSHGKQYFIPSDTPYTQVYNQSDNLVESDYYGENMKGVAARLGNVEQERTYIINDYSKIPRIGYYIDNYAISAVYCEVLPHYIKCTIGLTKDFNRISEYVGINSVKRMYEISERQVVSRSILHKEALVISGKDGNSDSGVLFDNLAGFAGAFINSKTVTAVKFAYFYPRNKSGDPLNQTSRIYLPCIGRAFGNAVHFSFSLKDNYSAGDRSLWQSGNSNIQGRWQTDASYTDYYGKVYWAGIGLVSVWNTGDNAPSLANIVYAAFSIPYTGFSSANFIWAAKGWVDSNWHRLRKDSRETISYNLEVEYKTTEQDLIIGSALAARCRYITEEEAEQPVIYATSQSINKFDKTFIPADGDIEGKYGSLGAPITYLLPESIGNGITRFSLRVDADKDTVNDKKYWVICSPISSKSETVINEDGEKIEQVVSSGGDILLAGLLSQSEINRARLNRILYFYIKSLKGDTA